MGKGKWSSEELVAMSDAVEAVSLSFLSFATMAERKAGFTWYATAAGYCRQIVADHEECCRFTFDQVVGAMAVLSQQNRWNGNLADTFTAANEGHAQAWLAERYSQMYHDAIGKSWAILYDGDLTKVRGPKVQSFAVNIGDPEDESHVTIDTHMLRAFGFKVAGIDLSNAGVYDAIRDGVIRAAKRHHIVPSALQAIIWTIIRDRK